jgi:hypothetical protein
MREAQPGGSHRRISTGKPGVIYLWWHRISRVEMLVLNHRTAPDCPTTGRAHVDELPICLAGSDLAKGMGTLTGVI